MAYFALCVVIIIARKWPISYGYIFAVPVILIGYCSFELISKKV